MDLFEDLPIACLTFRPIETHASCAQLQLIGSQQPREDFGTPSRAEAASPPDSATFSWRLISSQRARTSSALGGSVRLTFRRIHVGGDDQFLRQSLKNVVDGKGFAFLADFGVKENLKENITQFFLQFAVVLGIDSLEDLVGLFDEIGFQCLAGLFAIPRASTFPAQAPHNSTTSSNRSDIVAIIGERNVIVKARGKRDASRGSKACLGRLGAGG